MESSAEIPQEDVEPENNALVLEQATLPYESIFEWDMQDALGFYREIKRYNAIREEFQDDEVKTVVIDEMWRDREKYQVLRRFMWPPKTFCGFYYSRGYYEDYEARPTTNVADMKDAKRKLHEESKKRRSAFFRAIGHFINEDENKKGKKSRKAADDVSLSKFDPGLYDLKRFQIPELPKGTTEMMLQELYPKGTVRIKDDLKSKKQKAEVSFKTRDDAAEAFRKSKHKKIGNKKFKVFPINKAPDHDNLM